jgi:hypothetical protein
MKVAESYKTKKYAREITKRYAREITRRSRKKKYADHEKFICLFIKLLKEKKTQTRVDDTENSQRCLS